MSTQPRPARRGRTAGRLVTVIVSLLAAVGAVGPLLPARAAGTQASPFADRPLFVVPATTAATAAAQAAARGDHVTSAALQELAGRPQALWITGGTRASSELLTASAAAAKQHRVLVAVLYALPHRDCGGASAGGVDARGYRSLVRAIANVLGRARAAVVLEPDSLALIDCLPPSAARERYALLRDAATILSKAGAGVYLDAGHADWTLPSVMAARLRTAGVTVARGVALNVSSYDTTAGERHYGEQLAARLPGLHVIVDTSRNGRGPTRDAQWCNPAGRAVGEVPHASQDRIVDALLWIKHPGESDGDCGRHEPAAGTFWTSYALALLRGGR